MAMPPAESTNDALHQIAARLTVLEAAVAALIRVSPQQEQAKMVSALIMLEQLSLDEDAHQPAPLGIPEFLRQAVTRLAGQSLGANWRQSAGPHKEPE
jgi:hypothetical protein